METKVTIWLSFQINAMDVFTAISYILRGLILFFFLFSWTFQFARLVVKSSVTLSASELKTSSVLSLMKPAILQDQFTVIAAADMQSHSEWVKSSHDAFRLSYS